MTSPNALRRLITPRIIEFMRSVLCSFLLLVLATQTRAAETLTTVPATSAVAPTSARSFIAPIPLSTGWVEGFLLLIVWLFVAAILIGPLVSFFKLEPRSTQRFSDDPKIRM